MPFEEYNLGCYILDRLQDIGCAHAWGVPGDYTLRFLDDLMCHNNIEWVGCANELNAAYAADGYARRRGIGCVVTTSGVGELSAVNGIAGSASESVPVIHITGTPSTKCIAGRAKVHHTLGDGNFTRFEAISAQICCAAVTLNAENALAEVDRVLRDVLYFKKPGYIALPMDLATMPVQPPAGRLVRRSAEFSQESLAAFKRAVTALLAKASNPAVLAGHLLERYGLGAEAGRLLANVHIPYSVASLGKGAVDEHCSNFVGTYIAGDTPAPAKAAVEGADVCILLGVVMTDGVTGFFRSNIDMSTAIDVQPFHVRVGELQFDQIPMAEALKVIEVVCISNHSRWSTAYPVPETFKAPADPDKFDSTHFWNEVQQGLRPNDLVLVDLGTSSFTSLLLRLPQGAGYICQHMWASIGYAMPAALGAQIADPDRRVVCISGDGSMQMTVQELGTFARNKLKTTIFLINNDGYSIERFIRGPNAKYNDIAMWDWKTVAKGLCVSAPPHLQTITAPGATAALLHKREGNLKDFAFVEVIVDKTEGPLRMPGAV